MRYFIIYIVLFLTLSVGLYSCASKDREEAKAMADSVSVGYAAAPQYEQEPSALQSDTVSMQQLEAFSERAIQKLRDFSDLSLIIANRNYDKEFRKEAIKQALGLFTDSAMVTYKNIGEKDKTYTIEEDLNHLLEPDTSRTRDGVKHIPMASLPITSSSIAASPQRTVNGEYTGTIKFVRTYRSKTGSASHDFEMSFVIKRVRKQFGEESEEVWEVLLGDVRML